MADDSFLYVASRFICRLLEKLAFIIIGIIVLALLNVGLGWTGFTIIVLFILLYFIGSLIGPPLALFNIIYGNKHTISGIDRRELRTYIIVIVLYLPAWIGWSVAINNNLHIPYYLNGGPTKEQISAIKFSTYNEVIKLIDDCNVYGFYYGQYDADGPGEQKNRYIVVTSRNHGINDSIEATNLGTLTKINLPYSDREKIKTIVEKYNYNPSGPHPWCSERIIISI